MLHFLMKERNRIFGKIFSKGNNQYFEIQLEVMEFEDKNIFYAYTPSLNLMGYGKTKQEAIDSWHVVVENYLTYTNNKKTLLEDLQSYGWTITKKNLAPPDFSWLLQHNEQAVDVFNNHNFAKSSRPVKMPFSEVCA
jgi:hypothetical protein